MKVLSLKLTFFFLIAVSFLKGQEGIIKWNEIAVVGDVPTSDDPARFGATYARLQQINKKTWLAAYTVADQRKDSSGRFRLHLDVARSDNNGRSWKKISQISYYGRDLDNAQLIRLKNGDLLLSCRSTRFGESYWLPVYVSRDKGISWIQLSMIDTNDGKPGQLFKPDKGLYEPHFYLPADGRLGVMYANEKHVTETIGYSQIVSLKVSPDLGKTWGNERWAVYDSSSTSSRPGMPVWTKMENGKYILVYEVCGPEKCNVYFKISDDGTNWPNGLGTVIPEQTAAPYILSMSNGTLLVTSNNGNISISDDYGISWQKAERPWQSKQEKEKVRHFTYWSSLYQMGKNEIGAVTSVLRAEGGQNVQIRFGKPHRRK